ncbi:Na+/H+ antiporter subunit A [Bhargavaea cecembensis]|uniref:Na+/H+ antiporter subunit A n=1 Tax=Bhargavaea cecembensis TaxID=394098 RepID=UPI00058F6EBE|nr:Na+/H+ antiporter subunit A [Bhargavaea cecembensis]
MVSVLLLFAPVAAALFVPFLARRVSSVHTGWFVLAVPLLLFIYYLGYLPEVSGGNVHIAELPWIPSYGISFVSYIDGLSLLFTLLITGIGSLVVLYSVFYLDKTKERLGNFYVYLLMFMTAMLGVVQSDNVISLYLFWELTSISSFLLIGYWYTRDRSRYGALKSMMITVFGGLMMLGGFILLYLMGGTFSIRELIGMTPELVQSPLFTWSLILVLLGAFTKSAQFPFYIWLPDAMEAPTPVSAYLHSATMVKAGLYLVARFTPIFAASDLWVWLVTSIGVLTLFWGSFFAVKQTDLKGILAFSTVSQLGLIMSLLGAAGAAYHVEGTAETMFKIAGFAAIFHLFNHAAFKGSLFMVAGIVDHEAGTRDIRKLGGLMALMPVSFTIALIGSLSMAGLPPFGGFLSKELFLTGMLSLRNFDLFAPASWGTVLLVVAWIASLFTFIYSLYFVFGTFTGKHKPEELPKNAHEAPAGMLVSPAILAFIVVAVFFIPNVIGKWIVKPAVAAVQPFLFDSPADVDVHVAAWHGGLTPELSMTIGIVAVGLILFWLLPKWQPFYGVVPEALSLNKLYDASMVLAEGGANRLSRSYMGGLIRNYLIYMFTGIVVIVLGSLVAKDAFAIKLDGLTPVGPAEIGLILVLLAAATTTLIARRRLTAIISLGAVGYTVALLFVVFKAPDLALTQLVIETVSVALFLLAFYHLPKMSRHDEKRRFRVGNAIVAGAVGLMMALLAMSSVSQRALPSISEFYKETVHSEAGGGNIVNVILVDYRGFDTLFEIAVLSIAAIGIIGMIRLRLTRKGDGHEKQ